MYAIFLIIALALFAFIFQDDPSLLIAILKFVGWAALILGVLFLLAYVPWLCILIVIGLIIFAVYQSNHQNNSVDDIQNNNTEITHEYEEPIINNPNLTGFKAELQANTKTTSQVNDEEWIKDTEYILTQAHLDYGYIKSELLDMAKSAQYAVVSNQRLIVFKFECSYLKECIGRSASTNPTGRLYTSSYKENFKLSYWIKKEKHYNKYIDVIKNLAIEDDIVITPMIVEVLTVPSVERQITMPYTYSKDFSDRTHSIKVYLQCSIKY